MAITVDCQLLVADYGVIFMSLINQMLRDLEKRHGKNEQPSLLHPNVHATGAPASSKLALITGVYLGALALFGIFEIYHQRESAPKNLVIDTTRQITTHPGYATNSNINKQTLYVANPINPITTISSAIETNTASPFISAGFIENLGPINQAFQSIPPAIPVTESKPVERHAKKRYRKRSRRMDGFSETDSIQYEQDEFDASPAKTGAQRQAEFLYKQALTNNNYLAVPALERALALNPQHLKARLLLAKILHNQGQVNKTAEVLDQSLAYFPNNVQLINTRAQLFLQQKNPRAALNTLQRIEPESQTNETYLSLQAASYQQLNSHASAGKIYQRLTAINPEKAENWLGLALAAEKNLDTAQAAEAYQKALSRNTLKPSVVNYINQRLNDIK